MTIGVAAILALKNRKRIRCYLTCVGGGVFGNRTAWIISAIETAMEKWKHAPIDIKLATIKEYQGVW